MIGRKSHIKGTVFYILILNIIMVLPVNRLGAQQLSRQDILYVDSIMNRYYAWNEPGAVLLVAKDGIPLMRRAYGLANVELFIQNRPEYVFPIGSVTKQFTAVSILQLAQDGLISLNDDIRKYLPWYNTHGYSISIEQLLSHTSGIISYSEKQEFITKMMIHHSKFDIVQFFMNDSLLFEPGTDWSYSNSGYFLAGLILEQVTGMTLGEYMQENIFDPLGLTRTTIGSHQKLIPQSATGYSPLGNYDFKQAAYFSWTWMFGAGDIISNVDDLLKWDEALYSEKLLSREWLDYLWSANILSDGQQTNYGFGFVTGSYHDLEIISHGGGVYGFMSYVVRIPSEHIFVVILTNQASASPSSLAYLLALRAAGESYQVSTIRSWTDQDPFDYEGVYAMHYAGTRLVSNYIKQQMYRYITFENDTLYSQTTGAPKYPLLPLGSDLFRMGNGLTMLRFQRNQQDEVISLETFSEPLNYGPVQSEIKTSEPFPVEKPSVVLDEAKLKRFTGNYDFGDGYFIVVTVEGNRIFIQDTGRQREEIFAVDETHFFMKRIDVTFEFLLNSEGKVNSLIMNHIGTYEAVKID